MESRPSFRLEDANVDSSDDMASVMSSVVLDRAENSSNSACNCDPEKDPVRCKCDAICHCNSECKHCYCISDCRCVDYKSCFGDCDSHCGCEGGY